MLERFNALGVGIGVPQLGRHFELALARSGFR